MPDFTSDAERDQAVRLAMARQHIASRANTFPAPPWEALDEYQRERATTEARHWLRAADNAGLTLRHESHDALDLHERLRLIALVMHGLAGYADAREDSGDVTGAEQIREMIGEVRSVIPETADPGVIKFEWAVRFTSVMGREFLHPMDCEGDAREVVLSVTEAEASRWTLMRRTVCPWAQVFGD